MRKVLVLGAGQSSPALIHYLLEHSFQQQWVVTVADNNVQLAHQKIQNHPNAAAVQFDANDTESLDKLIAEHNIVINLLTPKFQASTAQICLQNKRSMVSASYKSEQLAQLETQAKNAGITLLSEIGLDPGLDHIMACDLVQNIRNKAGHIKSLYAYGSGVSKNRNDNPLGYLITWNPQNVVHAGSTGASYLKNGKLKVVPPNRIFKETWLLELQDIGMMEAYYNRDSLKYIEKYQIPEIQTIVRATLRYPGFCELWNALINIGLTQDMILNRENISSWKELTQSLVCNSDLASTAQIHPSSNAMEVIEWLGLNDSTSITSEAQTIAEALKHKLIEKLKPTSEQTDRVILYNEIEAMYDNNQHKVHQSLFSMTGDVGALTAMSKAVGYPAAVAAEAILNGQIAQAGTPIPVTDAINKPIKQGLEKVGILFDTLD